MDLNIEKSLKVNWAQISRESNWRKWIRASRIKSFDKWSGTSVSVELLFFK